MRKRMLLLLTAGLLTLSGCEESIFVDDYQHDYQRGIWIDPETGVNYLMFKNRIGTDDGTFGITARYHADGSLYVSEVVEKK